MTEENTQHLPDGRSFEERVFARFDALESHLNSRLDKMDARIDGLDARLTSLEEKVDQRLKETRPIWEQMLVRLDGIEKRLGALETEVDSLNLKFRLFIADIVKWQNKQDNLEERLRKLESESAK